MSNRNAIVRTALAAGLGLFTLQAQAADMAPTEAAPDIAADAELGPWKIRLRGLYVMTENEGKVDGVNNSGLSYSNTTIPELDINYYFNENIAAELILGTTYARIYGKGSIAGLGEIGKTWVLPPTLTLKYQVTDLGAFKPYFGAGINYTLFYNQDAKSANSLDVKNTFGAALQAGFDYQIDDHWDLNFDVKKLFLEPKFDVNVGGTDLTGKAKLNPWLIGTGIGYRF